MALLRRKCEVPEALIRMIQSLEKQSGYEVGRLHSDRGGEFTSSHLVVPHLQGHRLVFPSPETNGRSERMNGVILTMARSMLLGWLCV